MDSWRKIMTLFIQPNPVISTKNQSSPHAEIKYSPSKVIHQPTEQAITFYRDFYKVFNGTMANK